MASNFASIMYFIGKIGVRTLGYKFGSMKGQMKEQRLNSKCAPPVSKIFKDIVDVCRIPETIYP